MANQNRAEGKRFQLALHDAIAEASQLSGQDKWAALKEVAASLLNQAKDGNIQAIKEVADRLDGKSIQPMDIKGELNANVNYNVAGLKRGER